MGKSKSAKADVTDYYMSLHFGIACGPVDAIKGIYINEKTAWEGSVSGAYEIPINQPELFGGNKKEGGAVGVAHFLPGNATQVMPETLAGKLGRTSATCPAFRGVSTIFFHGGTSAYGSSGNSGFLWSSNNPIIAQTVWTKVQRAPVGLTQAKAMIGDDANPAHIIFEAMTNADWSTGMGATGFDVDSFNAAGDTLFDEEFGLSIIWTDQSKVEDFVSEINDHIQGTVYINPRTGLWTLKLLRDDYDVGTLRTITPDNARMKHFQRKMWGEVANEIAVSWTNPANEKEETVTVQNLAAISAQGGIITDNRNYYGVRNEELAKRLANRDLRSVSMPLATAEVELDRTAWDILPGEVIILNWDEDDITGIIMRVGSVDYGKVGDPTITVSLMEDVFSLERPASTAGASTAWTRPGEQPTAMANSEVLTLPAYFTASTDLQVSTISLDYPEVVAMVLAHQTGFDTTSFELFSEQVLANGVTSYTTAGTKNTLDRITLTTALTATAQSNLPAADIANVYTGPRVGGFVFIGSGGDAAMEIAMVDSFDGTNWVLARGVLDTIPRAWPTGTPVWFVNSGTRIVDDQSLRAAGEFPDYKLLSRTSLGILAEASAPVINGTLTARPHLPLRPANVKVNSTAFGSVAIGSANSVAITWGTRNRLLEDGQVVRWAASSVAPEYAQETVVSVYDQTGTLVYEQGSLWVETSLSLPKTYFDRYTSITLLVRSRRDGLWSLQNHSVQVTGLPGNGAASPPPTPPEATQPPATASAPGVSAFAVTGTAISNTSGASMPALLVTGTADNSSATGLVLRYRKTGVTINYAYHPTVALVAGSATNVTITGLSALTDYIVEAAYAIGNQPLSSWRTLSPNPVTTGAFVSDNAVAVGTRTAIQLLADVDQALADSAAAIVSSSGAAGSATAAQTAATAAQTAETQAEAAYAAADAARLQAQTASAAAATAKTQAETAYAAADGAKVLAVDAKNLAASSATAAAGSATAAAGSASTATTKATEAGTSATSATAASNTATTKATEAASSATGAATSATGAAASNTAAANSASAATTAKVAAEAARDTASGSATAAASSASSAAGSATAAGTSASAAQTSATSAATQAGNASTSATQASTSATGAAGSASSATTSASNAAGSATAAAGSATAAAGSASTASTKATEAGTSATSATAASNTATTKATEAASSATGAATSATGAAASNTAAANSASAATTAKVAAEAARDTASGSASAAATSASSAAGSATAAGTNASAAQTAATSATTQASNASTSATQASTSATGAAESAGTAATAATSATNSASAASSSASAASASAASASTSAALAQTSSSLSASVSGGTLNANPVFAAYTNPTGLPEGWWDWANASFGSRTTGQAGSYAYRIVRPVNGESGIGQTFYITAGYYILEADVGCEAGSFEGAGILFGSAYHANVINFATDASLDGQIGVGAPSVRRWRKIVYFPWSEAVNFYAMTGYTGFGTVGAKTLTWYRAGMRPASQPEIDGYQAKTDAATANAAIASNSAAQATINAAQSTTNSTLSASVGQLANTNTGLLNKNPVFAAYTAATGLPDGWGTWSSGSLNEGARVAGQAGSYAYRSVGLAGQNQGIAQTSIYLTAGYYVLEADVWCEAGSFQGGGLYVNGTPDLAVTANLHFSSDPSLDGYIGAGSLGVRRWRKLVYYPATQLSTFYLMTGWEGFTPVVGKTLTWYRAGIRPASQAEIDGAQAKTDVATANAAIASNAAAQATANSAQAVTNTTLTANVTRAGSTGGNSLNPNPNFAIYSAPSGLPEGWADWSYGNLGTRVAGQAGSYAYRTIGSASENRGLYQASIYLPAGYYVLEADVWCEAGSFQGGGLYVDGTGGGTVNLRFDTDPSTDGAVGVGGPSIRRWRKLVYLPATQTSNFYLMSGWSGFGTIAAKTLTWFRAGIRPASQAEVDGAQAKIDVATANATIATNAATQVTINSAQATTNTVLRANLSGITMNRNSVFSGWTGTLPDSWAGWASVANMAATTGRFSDYAFRQTSDGVLEGGIAQDYNNIPGLANVAPGWFVLEADIRLVSGSLNGSGIFFYSISGSNSAISFNTDPTVGGSAPGAGVPGTTYSYRKLVQMSSIPYGNTILHLMTDWSGFSATRVAKTIIWDRCSVRPATDSEITAKDAAAGVSSLNATVSSQSAAIADISGKVYARYMVEANASGVISGIYLVSSSGATGIPVSAFKVRANTFAVVASDESATKYPFIYDAVAGKLVLNEVIARAANIEDLSVTTLKLDGYAVTTEKLMQNSVTNSVSVQSALQTNINTPGEQTVNSLVLTTTGGRVELTMALSAWGNGGYGADYDIRLYRNGTLIFQILKGYSTYSSLPTGTPTGLSCSVSIPFTDYPQSGSNTYQFRLNRRSSYGGAVESVFNYMIATEVKR